MALADVRKSRRNPHNVEVLVGDPYSAPKTRGVAAKQHVSHKVKP